MSYALYLDDVRKPKTDRDWVVVNSFAEFCDAITELGLPDHVSFDHDLGDDEPSGYDCVKWLVRYLLDNQIQTGAFTYNAHSANPVGRDNILGLLQSWEAFDK